MRERLIRERVVVDRYRSMKERKKERERERERERKRER